MAYLSEIWRYPIKSHGRESVSEVKVTAGAVLPYDRLWAVTHQNSTADGSEWVACHNFSRGAKAPSLMAIATHFDEKKNTLTMSHPNKEELTFCPDTEGEKLIQWTKDLIPSGRSGSGQKVISSLFGCDIVKVFFFSSKCVSMAIKLGALAPLEKLWHATHSLPSALLFS